MREDRLEGGVEDGGGCLVVDEADESGALGRR
jgi:hypothetical protein